MDKVQENQNLYKKLKELRRSRGFTVHTLAKKIGENYQKVGRIERGCRSLTVGYLAKISKALEIPVESLLEQSTQPTSNQPKTNVLNDIVVFVEEYSQKTPLTTIKKAQLISKIHEVLMKLPEEQQRLFLFSLSECLQIL